MPENLLRKAWNRMRYGKSHGLIECPTPRPSNPVKALEHLLEELTPRRRESCSEYIEIIKLLKDAIPQLEIRVQELVPPIQQQIDDLEEKIRPHRYDSEKYNLIRRRISSAQERKWAIDKVDELVDELLEAIYFILEFAQQFPGGTVMSPDDFDQLLRYRKRHHEDVIEKLSKLLSQVKTIIAYESIHKNPVLDRALITAPD